MLGGTAGNEAFQGTIIRTRPEKAEGIFAFLGEESPRLPNTVNTMATRGIAGVGQALYLNGMGSELPIVQEVHGFRRTQCGCALCQVYCRHLPGALDPSDLARLYPPGSDLFAWAEEHLRALVDKSYPTLVPARREDSSCHWYFAGQCAVHEHAPYGCAFFDAHQPQAEVSRRREATVQAIRQDAAADGLYVQVWRHLRRKGLIGRPGDRAALFREMQRIRRRGAAGGQVPYSGTSGPSGPSN
jgi:hypothetical protein